MFSLLSGFLQWFFSKPNLKFLILGLDNAGKTTTLEAIKACAGNTALAPDMIRPTLGFNVAQIERQKVQASLWDVGGQTTLRTLWWQYFAETQGLLFVCDISDGDRFHESLCTLLNVMGHQGFRNRTVPIVVFLNKMDLLHPAELAPTLKHLFLKFHSLNWDSRGTRLVDDATVSLMKSDSHIVSDPSKGSSSGLDTVAAKRRTGLGTVDTTSSGAGLTASALVDNKSGEKSFRTTSSEALPNASEAIQPPSDSIQCSACKGGRPCSWHGSECLTETADQVVAAPKIVAIITGSALEGEALGAHVADVLISQAKSSDEALPWKHTAPSADDVNRITRTTRPQLYIFDSPNGGPGVSRQTRQSKLRLIDTSLWLQESGAAARLRSLSGTRSVGGSPATLSGSFSFRNYGLDISPSAPHKDIKEDNPVERDAAALSCAMSRHFPAATPIKQPAGEPLSVGEQELPTGKATPTTPDIVC